MRQGSIEALEDSTIEFTLCQLGPPPRLPHFGVTKISGIAIVAKKVGGWPR